MIMLLTGLGLPQAHHDKTYAIPARRYDKGASSAYEVASTLGVQAGISVVKILMYCIPSVTNSELNKKLVISYKFPPARE